MPSAFLQSGHGYPAMPLARQPVHRRSVRPGPLVLRTASLKSRTPTPDRDQTVSRRFEPSSRAALIGEQPNPWDLLQPQDATSRHRGAKPPNDRVDMDSRRSSACYPQSTFYPLSGGATTSDRRITKSCFRICSACMPRSQATLCLCAPSRGCRPRRGDLRTPPLPFGRKPPQSN